MGGPGDEASYIGVERKITLSYLYISFFTAMLCISLVIFAANRRNKKEHPSSRI